MDVSRETPNVTTKPNCYDLPNIQVLVTAPLVTLAWRTACGRLAKMNLNTSGRFERVRHYGSI